jgi:anti-sigma B factor antagonist
MQITDTKIGDVTVLQMEGEIDGSNAPQAQQRVLGQVGPGAALLLDMTGVTYMSSAGLRMLLSTYRSVTAAGGRMVLVGLSEDIEDTMSATGFLSFFVCQRTVDDGLAALNS